MKRLLLVFAALIFVIDLYSQVKEYYLPPSKYYKNSKIGLLEFQKFEAVDLSISTDSIYFKNKNTQANEKFAIDEVNYLRVQEGTRAGEYALYGGLLMGVSFLVAVIEIELNPNLTYIDNAGVIVVGFIAGGTLLGALIGSAVPKWKTYYVHKTTGFIKYVNLNLYSDYTSTGVQLKFFIE